MTPGLPGPGLLRPHNGHVSEDDVDVFGPVPAAIAPVCVAYRCGEPALPGGQLCRAHQRRLNRGNGLPTSIEKFPGDPSGYGTYGTIDLTEQGALCHECGRRFAGLGIHVARSHPITMKEYRAIHGIPTSAPILLPPRADGLPRRRSHPCRRCGTELLVPGKLCATCSDQRLQHLAEQRALAAEPRPRKQRYRHLTETETQALRDATPAELATLVPALQNDRVTSQEIGRALGHGPGWMITHFPQRTQRRKQQGKDTPDEPNPAWGSTITDAGNNPTDTPATTDTAPVQAGGQN